MREMTYFEDEEHQQSRLGLAGLVVVLIGGGAALFVTAGLPHLPASLPSWGAVAATLRGSEPPLEALGYIFTTAAWAIWLWLAASIVLRLVVGALDGLAHGAAWVSALRRLSDRVTLPIVRRLVDGALVAIVVVNLVGRTPTAAAAGPPTPTVAAIMDPRDAAARPALSVLKTPGETQSTAVYTVQPGDTLWAISTRFYGTGEEFPRLVAANVGQTMTDGRRFPPNAVIQPGWVLSVPLPSQRIEIRGELRYYVVEKGDTLRGIAARFLGDEMRWPEIFEANRGSARLDDGRTLSDPDLIWPGLRLLMSRPAPAEPVRESASPPPAEVVAPATASRPPPTPEPPAAPVPPTPAAASPTIEPTATPRQQPTAIPTPVVVVEHVPPTTNGTSPLTYGAAGLAAAAAGGAFLLARRRFRRSLDEPPAPDEPAGDAIIRDGFAEAELARMLAHRLHGDEAEPAVLLAGQVARFLNEHELGHVPIVTVRQGRRAAALTLGGGVVDQIRLKELAPTLGTRLGASARVSSTSDQDILLEFDGLAPSALLGPGGASPGETPLLIPLGALPGRQLLYANWPELGHVLVAGLAGGGAEVVLTSLVAALTARCRPDELRLWTIGSRRTLPD